MSNAIRIFDTTLNRPFIAEDGKLYADADGDGKIGKHEPVDPNSVGARYGKVTKAVDYLDRMYDTRVPGNTKDGVITRGKLDAVEQRQFESRPGTRAERTLLGQHLQIFDRDGDGKFGPRENYQGWRAQGFGRLASFKLAAGSSLIFGWRSFGTIHLDEIGEVRPRGSTGIYDAAGDLDPKKLEKLIAAFEAAWSAGVLTFDQARKVVDQQAKLGVVPKKQFESLYEVAKRMNKSETITVDQIRWLYDGTLLWRNAAIPDAQGHNGL